MGWPLRRCALEYEGVDKVELAGSRLYSNYNLMKDKLTYIYTQTEVES